MPRITLLCLPHLWIALIVHQVARLGSGHEAMSARKQLEEALKDVPEVINGFWYTADEFKALGFSDALVAAMQDTTNYRGVNALIQGHLVSTTYRSKIAPSVRYFCRPVPGETPAVNMQGSVEVAQNEHSRPSVEEAMRNKRRRFRSTATSVEEAEKKSGRRRSIRSNAPTPSPLRAHRSSSVASSQGSSIGSAPMCPPPRQPSSRPRSSRSNASRSNFLTPALSSRGSHWRILGCLDSCSLAALTRTGDRAVVLLKPCEGITLERLEFFAKSTTSESNRQRCNGFRHLTTTLIRNRAMSNVNGAWSLPSDVVGAVEEFTVHYESKRRTASPPRLELDELVLYRNCKGRLENAVVVDVHINAKLNPFYEIRLDDGRGEGTVGGRLHG